VLPEIVIQDPAKQRELINKYLNVQTNQVFPMPMSIQDPS
jgi:hypothetical protein